MNIKFLFFYHDHGYLQPSLQIENITEEFQKFFDSFTNPLYRLHLQDATLHLTPLNPNNHAFSPEMFKDFLNQLEQQGFSTTKDSEEIYNQYAHQYIILPHVGKEHAHYKHNLSYPANIFENLDIEQADFSDEICFLTEQLEKHSNVATIIEDWRNSLKRLTWLIACYHAKSNPSAHFLRTQLKLVALKTTPLPFTPGEYSFMDLLSKGIYRDDSSHTDPAQLQPLEDFINNNPQYKSLILTAALWIIFGTQQRLGKTNIPNQRMQLRIFQHPLANNFLDEYFNNKYGIYNQQHSIYIKEINDDKTRSTLIHELIHALANLIYDNHLELFPNDKEKQLAWKEFSKDLLKQLLSPPLIPETQETLRKLADFSDYEEPLQTQEVAARWLQVKFLSPQLNLPISKETQEFFDNEFAIFIRNIETRNKDFIEECGLYYLECFRNSQFFQTQDKVILDQPACDLLQAAFTRKLTLVDLVIEKLVGEKQSATAIVEHLRKNYISDYAILIAAAKIDYLPIIKILLKNSQIDINDSRTIKAFCLAAKQGHKDIVKFFIEAGMKVDSSHEQQLTALHYAAANGHLNIVNLLLKHKADVMAGDRDGNTALHWAAQNEHLPILEFLVNSKIDTNIKNKKNNTPLHLAVKHGNFFATQYLLANKAEINAVNDAGDTPLHLAIANEWEDTTQMLLKNNCECNIVNQAGCSPLYLAVKARNLDLVILLLTRPDIDVNRATIAGITPLHLATDSQQTTVALQLLKHPAIAINLQNCWGDNELHAAASQNNLEVINAIMDLKKLPIDDLNLNGFTALHLAIADNQVEAAELLIQRGANINAEDPDGNSPLHKAVMQNNSQAVELLLKINANPSLFANAKNHQGKTALHLAVESGYDTLVDLLLTHSDIYINERTLEGDTPLHIAIDKNHTDIAELLMKHSGININAMNTLRRTPLHSAIKQQNLSLAKSLLQLKHGKLDVNPKDYDGTTPLLLAAELGNEELIEALLAQPDIDFQARDIKGNTAKDFAEKFSQENGSNKILQLIQSKYDSIHISRNTESFWATPPKQPLHSPDDHEDIEIGAIQQTSSINQVKIG